MAHDQGFPAATRSHFPAEGKIRIAPDGLRVGGGIAKLCRREGIAQSLNSIWSNEFMEAGVRLVAGVTTRSAKTGEVQDLRREAPAQKECMVDLTFENWLLKKA